MARVLVLSYSNLRSDPRVDRQIRALARRHEVVTCGFGEKPDPASRHVSVPLNRRHIASKVLAAARLRLGFGESFYWTQERVRFTQAALRGERFDLVLANELDTLPVALELAGGAPVLFDAHEYSPLEYEDSLFWRFFFARYRQDLCRRYLSRAARMTTVCEGIAERYAAEYGVRADVITNAAPLHDLPVRSTDPKSIRMVHHGAAIPSRRTEAMLELMDHVDERYTLDLLLVPGDAAYIEGLRRRAARNPRIRFLPPVPMQELVALSAGYDVGLFLLPPTNFNYRMALPNKFFEFAQARLAVAIGPSPEMARLVKRFQCGLVAADFEPRTLAKALRDLRPAEIDAMKHGADRAARELNAEANNARLLALVDETCAV
jgi:hypothetical protein